MCVGSYRSNSVTHQGRWEVPRVLGGFCGFSRRFQPPESYDPRPTAPLIHTLRCPRRPAPGPAWLVNCPLVDDGLKTARLQADHHRPLGGAALGDGEGAQVAATPVELHGAGGEGERPDLVSRAGRGRPAPAPAPPRRAARTRSAPPGPPPAAAVSHHCPLSSLPVPAMSVLVYGRTTCVGWLHGRRRAGALRSGERATGLPSQLLRPPVVSVEM